MKLVVITGGGKLCVQQLNIRLYNNRNSTGNAVDFGDKFCKSANQDILAAVHHLQVE